MAESFVTQCPHCGTTFRVSEHHLNAAQGSVRCGACLKIFSAKDHLMQKAVPEAKPVKQKQPEKPQPASTFTARKDDDDEFLFEDDPSIDFEAGLNNHSDPNAALRDEDNFGFGEITEEMDTVKPDIRAQKAHATTPPPEHLVDSMWDALDDTLFEEEAPVVLVQSGNGPTLDNFTSDNLRIDNPGGIDVDYPASPTQAQSAKKANSRRDMVDQIDSEPLDLSFDARKINRMRWLWSVGSLVLLVVIALQFAWFGMENHAKKAALRPWYEKLCELADCELPGLVDVQKFRTGNLILRKDVRNPSNLIVDAILINQASFDQPFPQIVLEFRNLSAVLVADGAFGPEHYLNGEMTGAQLMPSKTPVHVSFSVVSPGPSAVNYAIRYQ